MKVLQNMSDKPKTLNSDEEGSLCSKTVIEYFEGEQIEIHSLKAVMLGF